jgi:PAS domain S-box-containing protein
MAFDNHKNYLEKLTGPSKIYETLVEASLDAVTATDMKGNIISVSARTLEQHGYKDAKDLVGRSAFEYIPQGPQKSDG